MERQKQSYRRVLAEAVARLEAAGVPEAQDNAWQLFEVIFETDRAHFLLDGGKEAQPEQVERLMALTERRANREPLQYLLGRAWFCGLEFFVDERVLIPRWDTEVLIEEVLKDLTGQALGGTVGAKAGDGKTLRVLDMCAGSGCIGLTTAYYLQERGIPVALTEADLSEGALEVTGINAKKLGVACDCVRTDLFRELAGQTFDVILSNPPYIVAAEIETLMPEVREHEPHMALDGGQDGLDFYRRLAGESGAHLAEGGRLYLEIGHDQGETVPELLREAGFRDVQVVWDLAGNSRVVKAIK